MTAASGSRTHPNRNAWSPKGEPREILNSAESGHLQRRQERKERQYKCGDLSGDRQCGLRLFGAHSASSKLPMKPQSGTAGINQR
jgi:hypothetical protein